MSVQLLINSEHFDLLLKEKYHRFYLKDVQNIEIKKKINYISILMLVLFLIPLSILIYYLIKVSYLLIFVMNFILIFIYLDFIYKNIFEIKLKIHKENYNLILNDKLVFFEFMFLQKLHNNQIE